MSADHYRLFLLCSVAIKDNRAWADLTTAAGIESSASISETWRRLDTPAYDYSESAESDFDYRHALEKARNFAPFLNQRLDTSCALATTSDGIEIHGRDVSLIRDEHGNFLLILAYRLRFENPDTLAAIGGLFKKRAVIENLGETDFFLETKARVAQEISRYAEGLAGHGGLPPEYIELQADAAFPLLVSESSAPQKLESLFLNEENQAQRAENGLLSYDYAGSFFHVGWNYTLAFRFPTEVNEQVFVLMAKMQMSYYTFRRYKDYFEEATRDLASCADHIDHEVVDFFDRLRIEYQAFFSQYSKFKLGLYPKYYVEFEKVESFWHIDQDIVLISDLFATQTEFVNKRHNDIAQRSNLRQQKALGFIAVMQIVAFISVVFDSYQFLNTDTKWFAVAVSAVASVLLVTLYSYSRAPAPKNVGGSLGMAKYKRSAQGGKAH